MTAQVVDLQVVEIFKPRKEQGSQWWFLAMKDNPIFSVSAPNASFDHILEEICVHMASMFC